MSTIPGYVTIPRYLYERLKMFEPDLEYNYGHLIRRHNPHIRDAAILERRKESVIRKRNMLIADYFIDVALGKTIWLYVNDVYLPMRLIGKAGYCQLKVEMADPVAGYVIRSISTDNVYISNRDTDLRSMLIALSKLSETSNVFLYKGDSSLIACKVIDDTEGLSDKEIRIDTGESEYPVSVRRLVFAGS